MANLKNPIGKLSGCRREISLEIPAKNVAEQFEKTLDQYANRTRIKGFRAGKAPKNIVKNMYYQEIKDSIIKELAPKMLNREFQAHNIEPLTTPVLTSISFKEGEPLAFKAQFEVWPDFTLPDLKKIKVKKKKVSVSEEELNEQMDKLVKRSTQYLPVEKRGVKEGDFIVAVVKGRYTDSKRFIPTEKVVILAGHDENEKTINDSILGMKPNEEKTFTIEYKDDNPNKKLAGRKIEYSLKMESIKEKKTPLLDDEFAKEMGNFEDLDQLKLKVREELMAAKEILVQREEGEEIMEMISEKLNFELPESLLEHEYLNVYKNTIASQPPAFQQNLKENELERLKETARKEAERKLRNHFILEKIAGENELEVTDEEYSAELERIARANNASVDQVMESISKDGRSEDLRGNLRLRKAVDFLRQQVIME